MLGTENVPYIVGLGEASRIALFEANQLLIHFLNLKILLLTSLTNLLTKKVKNNIIITFLIISYHIISGNTIQI